MESEAKKGMIFYVYRCTGAVGLIKGKMSKIPEIKSKKYKGTNSKFAIKVTGGVIEIFGGYVSSGSRVPVYPK